MEKLLELLNEHAHTYADHYDDTGEEITITFFSHGDQCFQYVCDGKYETLVDDVVISKRFGFIEWLIKKNKIDLDNEELISLMSELGERRNPVKCSLMLLAIQDEPINFLISMLK